MRNGELFLCSVTSLLRSSLLPYPFLKVSLTLCYYNVFFRKTWKNFDYLICENNSIHISESVYNAFLVASVYDGSTHCMKRVRVQSFSGPHLHAFGLIRLLTQYLLFLYFYKLCLFFSKLQLKEQILTILFQFRVLAHIRKTLKKNQSIHMQCKSID